MRVVAISDLHGWLPPDVPECDLLIIAGDICPDAPGTESRAQLNASAEHQARWLRERFIPWVERQAAREIVMCWGNHDYVGEVPAVVPPMPLRLMTDEAQEVSGLHIYASPWTSFAPEVWAFDVPPATLAGYMGRIPAGLDVLVTHGPPKGVLDRVRSGVHAGSDALLKAVALTQPRLHIFGHIHECRGQQGLSYNVAILDEDYKPYDMPVVAIEIE